MVVTVVTWRPPSAESTDACVGFLEDMVARGLGSPVLVISDGAPGLCTALDQVFPNARRQRCLIHYADLGAMPTGGVGWLRRAA